MSYPIKQSTAVQPLLFFLTLASDHISPATGKSPAVKLSKNGGTGVSPSGAISEIDSTNLPGWYKVAPNATDSNTLGPLALAATAASCDNCDMVVAHIVAYDPQDAVRAGLTALPNVASGSAGAIPTTGTGANQINVSGGRADANTTYLAGAAVGARYIYSAVNGAANSVDLPLAAVVGAGDTLVTGGGASGQVLSTSNVGGNLRCVLNGIWSPTGVNPTGGTTIEVFKTGGLVYYQPPLDGNGYQTTNLGAVLGTIPIPNGGTTPNLAYP